MDTFPSRHASDASALEAIAVGLLLLLLVAALV